MIVSICVVQIMTERMTNEIIMGRHPEPDSTFKLENPCMCLALPLLNIQVSKYVSK